jgi:hypothetical protein
MKFRIVSLACAAVFAAFAPASAAEPESIRQKVMRLRSELAKAESDLAVVEGRASGSAVSDPKGSAAAAPEPELSPFDKLVNKVVLRRSIFNKKAIDDPAEISYSRPGHGDESYAIDAGLGVELATAFWEPSAFNRPVPITLATSIGAEYHRNTALAVLKDQFEAGLRFEAALGSGRKGLGFIVNGGATYINDNVANTRVAQGSLELLPVAKLLLTDDFYDAGPLRWRWAPFGAIVYDNIFDTNVNLEKGERVIARYGAELQIWPLYGYLAEKLELRARYTAWSDLNSTGIYRGNGWSDYFEAGMTYWFNTPNPVGGRNTAKVVDMGLGLTYVYGEDPELDLHDVDLLTLSFQAKF